MQEQKLIIAMEWEDPTALTALCIDIPPTAAAMCRVPFSPKLCPHCCSCWPQVLLTLLWFLCIVKPRLCQYCLSGAFVFCVGMVHWHVQLIQCSWERGNFPLLLYLMIVTTASSACHWDDICWFEWKWATTVIIVLGQVSRGLACIL